MSQWQGRPCSSVDHRGVVSTVTVGNLCDISHLVSQHIEILYSRKCLRSLYFMICSRKQSCGFNVCGLLDESFHTDNADVSPHVTATVAVSCDAQCIQALLSTKYRHHLLGLVTASVLQHTPSPDYPEYSQAKGAAKRFRREL